MKYTVRAGTYSDSSEIIALLPRLADFDVPQYRSPDDLWLGDKSLIQQWAIGERPEVDVAVAINGDRIVGIAVVSAKPEMLSGEPSAHLETLAVDVAAQGYGVGAALMREAEAMALKRGATCISLHVFSANKRARDLYERHGYHDELIRYYKPLTS